MIPRWLRPSAPILVLKLMLTLFVCLPSVVWAESPPPYQTDFPPEEFQARWKAIFDRIGANALAIVQGAPQPTGFLVPRQSNEFYHLCGIETPHAYLILDGRDRQATLLLPPRDARLESAEGKVLSADDAELVKRSTGVSAVASTRIMTEDWLRRLVGSSAQAVYTPFAPAEHNAECRGELRSANAAIARDPWDGRPAREAQFVSLLKARLPGIEVRDLTPILDELRAVKSPREIALIRRASELAGRGLIEAMKNTRPGVFEYQLDAVARYVFLAGGARLEGYRSITASGTDNIWNMHYYRNTEQLTSGDLVLMDFAPEYHYYTSDIARMWPVNGRFSAEQRELLQFVLEYRNCIMKRIRPGVTPRAIREEAIAAMEEVFTRTKFSKPIYEKAARRLVNSGGGVFSHPVGMAVHDDGGYARGVLKPGHVFSIDPQLRVPEERLYYRYEDVIVITESGFENFTAFLPAELDDIEKLVGRGGMLKEYPPQPESREALGSAGLPPLPAPPKELGLDPFYTKFVNAHGLPVVGSAQVSDYALREAAYLVDQMLSHRPEIREALIKYKFPLGAQVARSAPQTGRKDQCQAKNPALRPRARKAALRHEGKGMLIRQDAFTRCARGARGGARACLPPSRRRRRRIPACCAGRHCSETRRGSAGWWPTAARGMRLGLYFATPVPSRGKTAGRR
jgi:Xaa-Pro aminopeptidase